MKMWVLTILLVLNISSIRGAKMPRNNILGLHFDMLSREAHLVLGRKQSIFEVMGNEPRVNVEVEASTPSGGGSSGGQYWTLEDGHSSELELPKGSLMVQNRWVARVTGGRPLRYHFLEPMVIPSREGALMPEHPGAGAVNGKN
jgi:hypothetical protein